MSTEKPVETKPQTLSTPIPIETTPTTKTEIRAWYLYDVANSPFGGVAISLFIPLILTELSEERACLNLNCDINGNNIATHTTAEVSMTSKWLLKPTSYASLMIGISAFIQAIIYIQYSSLSDYGDYRKKCFNICSIITAIVTMLFIVFGSYMLWFVAGLWTILATCVFGLCSILYNSYLPILVENHEDIIQARKDNKSNHEICDLADQITDHLSSVGFAWGYVGGLLVTIICSAIVLFEPFPYKTVNKMNVQSTNSLTNSINTNVIFNEELYSKKVLNTNIYYDIINNNNLININGIQFNYINNIIGNIHGNINNNMTNIDFSNDNIIKVKTYQYNSRLIGINFYSKTINDWIMVGNITGINYKEYEFNPGETTEKYSNYVLSGISSESNKQTSNIESITLLFSDPSTNGIHFPKGKSNLFDRLGVFICGLWYLIFGIISIKYMKNMTHEPLPKQSNICTFGFIHSFKFLKKIGEYPELAKYLIGYFFFSDGIGTYLSCGTLFTRQVLNMSTIQLGIQVIETYIFGIIGNYLFLKIQEKKGYHGKSMLLFHIIFMSILPLYIVIGAIPGSPFGVVSVPEFYIYNVFFAMNIGSIQSYARAVYAQLVPKEHESELFAFFEITNKGSSWIGPVVVAAVSDATDFRFSLIYVFFAFAISIPFVLKTNVELGRTQSSQNIKNYVPTNVENQVTKTIELNEKENQSNTNNIETNENHKDTDNETEKQKENENENDSENQSPNENETPNEIENVPSYNDNQSNNNNISKQESYVD